MRPVPILVALAAVPTVVALSASAEDGSRGAGGPAAMRLLETRNVPARNSTIATRTKLVKGRRYKVVVTGTKTSSYTRPDGRTAGDRRDAIYCYEEFGATSSGETCSDKPRRIPGLTFHIGRERNVHYALDEIDPKSSKRLPYTRNHRYAYSFRAPRSGKLKLQTYTAFDSTKVSGGFKVRLYGGGDKPQPAGCEREDARVAQGDGCVWQVTFRFTQDGLPKNGTSDNMLKTETNVVGKVFFKRKPKEGRASEGSGAGTFAHEDVYIDPITYEETRRTFRGDVRGTATYRYREGQRRVKLGLRTTDASDECALQGRGVAQLVDNNSPDPDEAGLALYRPGGGVCDFHEWGGEDLKVTVSRPRLVDAPSG